MKDIKNYKHSFQIMGNEIVLNINYSEREGWECDIIKGDTGIGKMSGGNSKTLEEYIAKVEKEHRYGYVFYNHGYSAAKSYAK